MRHLLTVLLFISSLFAKNTDFSIIVDKPFNDALFSVTEDYKRTISAAGFVHEYKDAKNTEQKVYNNAFDYLSSLSNSYSQQIHVIKVD